MNASGARFATSSIGGSVAEDCIIGMPNSPAASATVATPPSQNSCSPPTGAISTGMRILRPYSSVEQSTFCTLRSTRGLNAMQSSDCRFRASVVSVSVPPTM